MNEDYRTGFKDGFKDGFMMAKEFFTTKDDYPMNNKSQVCTTCGKDFSLSGSFQVCTHTFCPYPISNSDRKVPRNIPSIRMEDV